MYVSPVSYIKRIIQREINGDKWGQFLWWQTREENICSGADTVGLLAQCSIILARHAWIFVRMSLTLDQKTCHSTWFLRGWITMSGLTGHDIQYMQDNKANSYCLFYWWYQFFEGFLFCKCVSLNAVVSLIIITSWHPFSYAWKVSVLILLWKV